MYVLRRSMPHFGIFNISGCDELTHSLAGLAPADAGRPCQGGLFAEEGAGNGEGMPESAAAGVAPAGPEAHRPGALIGRSR